MPSKRRTVAGAQAFVGPPLMGSASTNGFNTRPKRRVQFFTRRLFRNTLCARLDALDAILAPQDRLLGRAFVGAPGEMDRARRQRGRPGVDSWLGWRAKKAARVFPAGGLRAIPLDGRTGAPQNEKREKTSPVITIMKQHSLTVRPAMRRPPTPYRRSRGVAPYAAGQTTADGSRSIQ